MRPLVRNIFLLFGIAAIVAMACSFDMADAMRQIKLGRAAAFLPLVVGVWVAVYALNARAFQVIVNTGADGKRLSFLHSYKLTVSGFAFSYTTPFGFGGGPYRVMELNAYIGISRSMASVALYSMMHILSHFIFWATGIVLFIIFYFGKMTPSLWSVFGTFAAVLTVALFVFSLCYRKGVIVALYRGLLYIPLLKRYTRRFWDTHEEQMRQVDRHIAYLHERPRAFWGSLLCEYLGRIVNSLEFYFILLAFGCQVSLADAILVLAFSSFVGNVFFFFPMQMGAREGGLALIIQILGVTTHSGLGIFAALYTRIRELFWVFVGVSLVKVGNRRLMK